MEELRRTESVQTASKSQMVYSSYLWKPCRKKSMPVNQRKKVRKMPL